MNIHSFIPALEILELPYVIVDAAFSVLWSNPYIQAQYPYLCAVDSVRSLLSGYDLEELREKLRSAGRSLTLPSLLPMVSTVLNLAPVLDPSQKELEGAVVQLTVSTETPAVGTDGHQDQVLFAFNRSLREPLASMLSSLSGLSSKLEAEECYSCGDYMKSMTRDCYKMLRACISITEYSRFCSGIAQLKMQTADLSEYLKKLLDAAAILLRDIGVSLTYSLPEETVSAAIDPDKLSMAIFSILSNSCSYCEGGCTIHVTVTQMDSAIQIKIADSGYGMSPETLSHALEPYFTRGLDEYSFPGLGLGLPLAQKIIEAHGGSMAIQSEQDKGTTVAFTLPYPAADSPDVTFSAPASQYLMNRFSNLHIFLSNVLAPEAL